MTDPKLPVLPDGLPPLPDPPAGHRWVYRGERWKSEGFAVIAYYDADYGDSWKVERTIAIGAKGCHYAEAVPLDGAPLAAGDAWHEPSTRESIENQQAFEAGYSQAQPAPPREWDQDALRALVDRTWNHATGSTEVPSHKWADSIITGREWSEAETKDSERREVPARASAEGLQDLIHHIWVHEGYERAGYYQMTAQQKALYDRTWHAVTMRMNQEAAALKAGEGREA